MANTSTLTVRIIGNSSDAVKEIGKVDGALGKLGRGAGIVGGALAGVGLAAGVALFQIGSQFDDLENTIVKGTGATGTALEELVDNAKNVLQTVPDASGVVATALADVNTFFGQTGETLEESTGLFLDFARVADTDVSAAIGGLDAAFTQFGEEANVDEALGDFLRISQATGAPVDKLIGQLETFGPLFANAGFSIEETTALFGGLEQAGVDITRVGPALNKFFRDAATAGEDPRQALEGITDAISGAATEADALNIATSAFGAEGAQRMTSAIRSGNFDLDNFNGLLGEGAGLVGEQAEATETFGQRLDELKNTILVALAPAAEALFEALEDAIEALAPYIEEFAVWFGENLPLIIETLQEKFVEWGPVVLDVIKSVAQVFIDNWPAIQVAIEIVATEAGKFITLIQENWPLISGIISGVITAVTIAFAVFTGDWELLKTNILGVVDGIKTGISDIWDSIVETISGLGGKISDAAVGLFDGVIDAFKGAINFIIDGWNSLSFSIPGFSFGPVSFDGFTLGVPDIPRLATGGAIYSPMVAVVGDNPNAYRDPEIVAPQSFIRDAVRDVMEEFGAGGNLTINANGYTDTAALARDVDDGIRRRNALAGVGLSYIGDSEAA